MLTRMLVVAALTLVPAAAFAQTRVHIEVNLGPPPPPPVVVYTPPPAPPQPVYTPPTVVYTPPTVVYRPAPEPVYEPTPQVVVYRPAPQPVYDPRPVVVPVVSDREADHHCRGRHGHKKHWGRGHGRWR